jgi:hypothetical protein
MKQRIKTHALDAQANALWEERHAVGRELEALGREKRRLTELLPWWAAPGRSMVDSEGNLSGPIVWPAASPIIDLPSTPAKRRIRFGSWQIDDMVSHLWDAKRKAAVKRELLEKLNDRCKQQKCLEREVGLPAVKRRIAHKLTRIYDIRKELTGLAEAGSLAALGALHLNEFGRVDADSTREVRDVHAGGIAILNHALPCVRGLLHKHVELFLNHPGKQRLTCRFLTFDDDDVYGFVPIDRERVPPEAIRPSEPIVAKAA